MLVDDKNEDIVKKIAESLFLGSFYRNHYFLRKFMEKKVLKNKNVMD